MKIAYLVNQYPKVSHSFIRREIAALEASNIPIARYSIRSCAGELVDPADQLELEKTRLILGIGIFGLIWNFIKVAIARPKQSLRAFKLAFKVGLSAKRGFLRLFYPLIYLAEACVLLGWLEEEQITHLHAHFGTNSTTVAMLCKALGGPSYSFTVHGPYEFDHADNLALAEKIERASFVATISSFSRSQLYRLCSYEQWEKIHVIHCGVDSLFLHQPTSVISDTPNIVCVGRLCEEKGQMLLVEAINILSEQGIKCQLTLVGDGPLRPKIEALIKKYNLQTQVQITGWASGNDVQKYILESRTMVLPSFAEGLPVVLMEALALERPVISTYIAGIPELVKPGVNGWLVPAGSVEELVEAIRTVLESPIERLEIMGKAGTISVQRQHDISQEAIKLANLFRSSLEH
jgi:colanic acid/amylovoran biosynthesis glycosyltransferase